MVRARLVNGDRRNRRRGGDRAAQRWKKRHGHCPDPHDEKSVSVGPNSIVPPHLQKSQRCAARIWKV